MVGKRNRVPYPVRGLVQNMDVLIVRPFVEHIALEVHRGALCFVEPLADSEARARNERVNVVLLDLRLTV